jgi:hypothetical protein
MFGDAGPAAGVRGRRGSAAGTLRARGPLEGLAATVDLEIFRADVVAALGPRDPAGGGRPGLDVVPGGGPVHDQAKRRARSVDRDVTLAAIDRRQAVDPIREAEAVGRPRRGPSCRRPPGPAAGRSCAAARAARAWADAGPAGWARRRRGRLRNAGAGAHTGAGRNGATRRDLLGWCTSNGSQPTDFA